MEVLAAVGGALISASIGALFEKLRSSELLKFARKAKLDAELKNLEDLLINIDAFVEGAEERQTTEPRVQVWLDKLRDLAYDIEDMLDEFSTEALKRRVTKENSHVPSFFTGVSPASLAFKHKMASRMKEITARLQHIATQERTLNLTKIERKMPNKPEERPPTTSLEDSHIYGRNDDKEALVQTLLRHEDGSNPISVIPIVGMGGIGKTTLAQSIYNDNNVTTCFDTRVWVCVSENFDVVTLTGRILRSITSEILDLKDLDFNLLQEKLKEKLSQKKFLLILDDFWDEDYLKWIELQRPFVAGAAGSKIVITTRKDDVAKMAAPDVPAYHVKQLPDGECLSLLAHHALGAQNFDSHSSLKESALEMVKRCKGLPLAVKVLGGVLRRKPSRTEWKLVLESKMWNLPETRTSPLSVLKLSYNDLPSYLKRCFIYCAIFPKDYEFNMEKLVLLWMAEGFLDFPQGGKRMEDVGTDYFKDLASRSFFQASTSRSFFQASSENQKVYVMHDLISDLAVSIGGEICYNYENKNEGSMSNSKFEKVRHASFFFRQDNDLQEYGVFTPMKSLRTLLGFPIYENWYSTYYKSAYDNQFYKLLFQSKKLRVLSLTCLAIKSLPDSIGDLKHLRHLNLTSTRIEQLPQSVCSLFNLLTLLLCGCEKLKKLPDGIGNLVNLRHLDISNTDCLQKIPSSIGMLTNLQTLSKFVVNEGHGATLTELKNLNNLRGILSIEGLRNVTNLQDAKSANLKEKQGLEEVDFRWNPYNKGNDHDEGNDMSVLESLEPHQNLKRLTIYSYRGSEFPSWVSHPSFSNLVSVNLERCGKIELLPALHNLRSDNQQSLLEFLRIMDCASLKYFATNFKLPTSLKRLSINYCENLLSLPDGLMMLDDNTITCQSSLESLEINDCKQLTSFPLGKLPATLKYLGIHGCEQMKLILEDMFCNNMALEWIDISEIDNIRVFPSIDCLQSLWRLYIGGWSALESFSEMGLCNRALQELTIMGCTKLLSLPSQMDTLLPSLRKLTISRCPCLVSLTQGGGGLPKTLTSLEICDCENLRKPIVEGELLTSLEIRNCENLRKPIVEGELHLFSSLKKLALGGKCSAGADVVLFPDDDYCLLPTSLRSLEIRDFMNLESLGLELRKLTYLHYLRIDNCPKLRYLPKEALPSSLRVVERYGCPLLKEHWLKNFGCTYF